MNSNATDVVLPPALTSSGPPSRKHSRPRMATRMGVPAVRLAVPARGRCTASRRCAPVLCAARPSIESPAATLRACRLHLASLAVAASVAVGVVSPGLAAAPAPSAPVPVLCDATCVSGLDRLELVTLPNGLKYRDIEVGKGPSPESGFQARPRRLRSADCDDSVVAEPVSDPTPPPPPRRWWSTT